MPSVSTAAVGGDVRRTPQERARPNHNAMRDTFIGQRFAGAVMEKHRTVQKRGARHPALTYRRWRAHRAAQRMQRDSARIVNRVWERVGTESLDRQRTD